MIAQPSFTGHGNHHHSSSRISPGQGQFDSGARSSQQQGVDVGDFRSGFSVDGYDHIPRPGCHTRRAQRGTGFGVGGFAVEDAVDDDLALLVASQIRTQPGHFRLAVAIAGGDVSVGCIEFCIRFHKHVDQVVMGGDLFQQRPVARAYRVPVDAVHVLTPVVITHQPGVLVEHLPPLVTRKQLAAQPIQVHGDTVLILGPHIYRLHPQVVAVANHHLSTVPTDCCIVTGIDHHGQFAFGDVVNLDAVLRLLSRQLPRTEHTGVRGKASPQDPLSGSAEPVVATGRHRQWNHPVLHTLDIQGNIHIRFHGILVRCLVLRLHFRFLGLTDGPTIDRRPERGRLLRAQGNHIGSHGIGETKIKIDLVIGRINGPARQKIQVPTVETERGREVIELPAGQFKGSVLHEVMTDQPSQRTLIPNRLPPHHVTPAGTEGQARGLPLP